HRLTAWVNPLGKRTTFGYDGTSASVKVVRDPAGQRTTYAEYANVGPPMGPPNQVMIDPRGKRTTVTYTTGAVNPQGGTRPPGETGSSLWLGSTRLSRATDGLGRQANFVYATLGDRTQRLAEARVLGSHVTFTYDASYRVKAVRDGLGNRTTLAWDGGGN